jgi:putative transposase
MPLRKISFAEGEFYHLYNRGNSKQQIFHDDEDYKRFAHLLFACNQLGNFKSDDLGKNQGLLSVSIADPIVSIGAYCLMPNHFHILITQNSKDSISKFMQKLITAYVMYYNKKYQRTGALFEGRFKSEHLNSDRYLKYIYSYIHLNPLKLIDKNWKISGLIDREKSWSYLEQYAYSSFIDFASTGSRLESKILNTKAFPDYFPNTKFFLTEIKNWFNYGEELALR